MLESQTKIAYILTPITFGGAEKVSLNFLRTVDRNRFEIIPVLLLRPWEEPPYFADEIEQLGYNYITLPVSLKQSGDPLRVFRVAWRLMKLLKQGQFDLVHSHGYFADICAIPIARILKIKTITTCHGFIANDSRLKWYNILNVYALKISNTVISVSDGIKHELIKRGVKSDKIKVILNAVAINDDTQDFSHRRQLKKQSLGIKPDEFVVGYLGRLSEEKGLKFLIKAVAQIRDAGILIRLLIVGDGPEKKVLEKLVNAAGLEDSISFTGFQTDIENWLPAFDVFALPSLTEGTPMALLEAMAAGVPVVATSVGGVPKIIEDGTNGLLVNPSNCTDLSERIQLLIGDYNLRDKLVLAGLDTVKKKYGLDRWCRAIERYYLPL